MDDATIRRLASEPERPLFPLFRHAEAMAPLVIVLAFLPTLYAVENRTLSEEGAWQGLVSLRCAKALNLAEAVDPAALEPDQPHRFQPPLMTWLTALSMRAFGVGTAAGLATAAYLCTAGVIVAGYVLGRRFGGEPAGLLSAAFLAAHPQILEGAQEPARQSPTAMFAMLSLAGVVAHWQRSSAIVSYQLLLGGLALGMCLLAGGPVAPALLAILLAYVAFWKLDAARRKRSGLAFDKNRFSRRTAFRSLTVLAATGFAAGGWQPLLMSSRYGTEFWEGWLSTGAYAAEAIAAGSDGSAGGSRLLEELSELSALALPLAGLSLLGAGGIVRDALSRAQDPADNHRILLLVWIVSALALWLLRFLALGPAAPTVEVWKTLLVVPLMITAALGLVDVAERRVGFWPALAAGSLTLLGTIFLLERSHGVAFAPAGESGGAESLMLAILLAGLLLAALGPALSAHSPSRDAKRRVVLSGLILVLVFAHAAIGALAVRHTSRRDRELDELRSGLVRLTGLTDWVLVASGPPGTAGAGGAGADQPPPQVRFTLQRLWPEAALHPATGSWETALSEISSALSPAGKRTAVFVTWSPRGRLRTAVPPAEMRSVAAPFLYGGLEIAAYVREAPSEK